MSLTVEEVRRAGDLSLIARQLVKGFMIGLHKSPYRGFSVEFAEHRLFNPGESTRHIDWKLYARTDRLYVKRYEEETNMRCLIMIDRSSSMYYPLENPKIRFSVYAASALVYLLHRQRDAVGLAMFSDHLEELTPIKSSAIHLNKLFISLEQCLKKQMVHKKTSISKVLHEISDKIYTHSLIILFTDMFDGSHNMNELFKSLQRLKHAKHEILLFHTTDHNTEFHFNFDNKLSEFVDMETKEKIRLNPSSIKSVKENQLQSFHREIKRRCQELKIDLVHVDVRGNFSTILQAYLIKRSHMM